MNRASYRGQPLVALMLILGGWVAVRVMVWDATAAGKPPLPPPVFAMRGADGAAADYSSAEPAAPPSALAPAPVQAMLPPVHVEPSQPRSALGMPPVRLRLPSAPAVPLPPRPSPFIVRQRLATPVPTHLTVTHQLLWMAALARLPLPASVVAPLAAAARPAPAPAAPAHRDPRWSADAWLLLRRGGNVAGAAGFVPATYGASQTGAVVRYRLEPESAHRPSLYLRGSAALNGSHEREAALGLSARPFAHVPLVLAAEARANDQPRGTRVRPAVFAYTELPPLKLPHGAHAEFYGQAGYVGGDFASAFADGQLRVDRRFLRAGQGELRAGGGVWGGAQKGASRLDIGPTATLGMPLGGTAGARVQVDWRFRVTGNAAPASGPALTLSAGF